ncbi:DUF4174 domain-containing protein [Polaribacter marinivivus]|uniref:DUF4174 domain-containing protein n=1 Tax=Polaribacter marinivivus TaxID=1524260 RepID=A0ABV8RAZ0_9FLAO
MTKIIFFCIFSFVFSSYSQDVKKHKWENRVLLVFTHIKNDEIFNKQISNLLKEKKGLTERKLIIYQFVKDQYSINFDSKWLLSSLKKSKYKTESENFKVVLIGLDGGIKLEQTSLLSTKKLFTIIDGMPMRRNEIRNK